MANQVFKGITVEFNGDTSNLDEAISQLNKEFRNLKSELVDVNRKLKNDPLNSDLINQKLTILNKTIETAQKRVQKWSEGVTALKTEMQKLKNEQNQLLESVGGAENLNKKQKKSYNELSKEIEKYQTAIDQASKSLNVAQRDLERYESTLAKFKSSQYADYFKNIAKQAKKVEGALKAVSNITAPISLVSGAALTASAKAASDFETQLISVQKVLKDVGSGTRNSKGITEIKQDIEDLAKTIPGSIDEITSSFANAAQLGIQNDDLKEFVEVLLRLDSATEDISASEGAMELAQFYNLIGGDVNNVDKLANALVRLGNNTQTTEGKIMDMASNLGASASQVKMTEAQILGLASALTSMGLDGAGAGTAISSVLTKIDKAIDNGTAEQFANVMGVTEDTLKSMWKTDAASTFVNLIGVMKQASENGESVNLMLQDMEISEIRQDRAMKALINNYSGLVSGMQMAEDAYTSGNDLVEESTTAWGTFASSVQLLVNNVKLLGNEIGGQVLEKIQPFIDLLVTLSQKLLSASDETKKSIANFLILATAITPLISGVGSLIGKFAGISEAIGKFVEGSKMFDFIEKIRNAFSSGLLPGLKNIFTMLGGFKTLGIVALIALLVAGLIHAWKTSDKFRTSVKSLWERIKELGATIKEIYDETLAPMIARLKEILEPILDSLLEIGKGIWQIIVDVLDVAMALINWLIETAAPFLKELWDNFLGPLAEGLATTLLKAIEGVSSAVETVIGWAVKGIDKIKELLGLKDEAEMTQDDWAKVSDKSIGGLTTGKLNNKDLAINSAGIGTNLSNSYNSQLNLSNSIIVNNNGEPIDQDTVRSWANSITDIVSENLGRRIYNV